MLFLCNVVGLWTRGVVNCACKSLFRVHEGLATCKVMSRNDILKFSSKIRTLTESDSEAVALIQCNEPRHSPSCNEVGLEWAFATLGGRHIRGIPGLSILSGY